METKEVMRAKPGWPTLFDNGGWFEKFFNMPLDEYFNVGKVMNVPAVNVKESDGMYAITLAAPGLEKKDFTLEVSEGIMTIRAEKENEEKEEKGRFNRREYNYTSWSRSFTLPEDCDDTKIAAEYKNGELKITIPRTEVKQVEKAKTINII